MTCSSQDSLVFGPEDNPLLETTLGKLVDAQALKYGDRTAAIFSWQRHRLSYEQLAQRSKLLAKSMLDMGLKHGDCVGIMAGNCYQYIEIFLGAARIGCPVVVLNNTYTKEEMMKAISVSNCRLLFLSPAIGQKDQTSHIRAVCDASNAEDFSSGVQRLVILSANANLPNSKDVDVMLYSAFVTAGHSIFVKDATLRRAERAVKPDDILNLQFTSGTTGSPKAAMLTHRNLINNGYLVGSGMEFGQGEVLCCPPPLYHCFGLAMGFLGSFSTGSTIVFPSDQYNAGEALEALRDEKCSSLYGVPTMFLAMLEANRTKKCRFPHLKKALAAGAPVPLALMERLKQELGIANTLIAYGMTETSPVTCMTRFGDTIDQLIKTVGWVLPHTGLKIIDQEGKIVPRGVRGQVCTSGYALQKGYWKNEAKTKEVMQRDKKGILWMHTGDEGTLDSDGYCSITGRIKDLIIRGGENIFPLEIEERLLSHKSVQDVSVVGVSDEKHGEAVACFIKQHEGTSRPTNAEVADWVRQTLGRHKAPQHVFWIGDAHVCVDFPKTGSGKHQKHVLKALGNRLIGQGSVHPKAKL